MHMKRYYGTMLKDNYEIKIMDNNINFVKLHNGDKYINIIDENNYEIINI